jgi:hypothetical protein
MMLTPIHASDVQIKETKQAYYAGASLLWYALMQTLDTGTEATDADLARMESIQEEVDAFGEQLDRDIFKIVKH